MKNYLVKSLLCFCLLFGEVAIAAQAAKVILMRGEVTEIAPNGESRTLKKGEWVQEGSKVVTKPKSFAKLLFNDKSSINVGPDSNMAITQYPKGKPGVISVLKGQIRAKVEKDLLKDGEQEDKSKMFVRTKSAAMGVRGTDFIVGFNPSANATKLDVVSGVVAVVNTPDIAADASPAILDGALNGPNAVKVEKGMRTTVADPTAPPAPPKEIPKAEMEGLQKNDEGFSKPVDEDAPKEEKKEEKKEDKKEEEKKEDKKEEAKEEEKKEEAKEEEPKEEAPKEESATEEEAPKEEAANEEEAPKEETTQSESEAPPSEGEAPATEEPVVTESSSEEPSVETTFNDPIPPDVPEDMFVSESPEVEETTIETTEIERLPTAEPTTEQITTETANEPPPEEGPAPTEETAPTEEPQIVETDTTTDLLLEDSALAEVVEDTTTSIQEDVVETAEEVTETIQNPNNFTRTRLIFSTQ